MLKVGILLNTPEIPSWQCAIVEKFTQYARPTFITMDSSMCATRAPVGGLYRMFQEFDRSRRSVEHDALTPASARPHMQAKSTIPVSAGDLTGQTPTIATLKEKRLDIIIALVLPKSIEGFSELSKYGLWYFWHDFGQTSHTDGSTVGFWEVIKRRPYMRSSLMISRGSKRGTIVAHDTCSAVHFRSHNQTRNEHLWKISQFPFRAAKQLTSSGDDFLDNCSCVVAGQRPITVKRHGRLSNVSIAAPLFSYMMLEILDKIRRRLFRDRWVLLLGYSRDPVDPQRLTPAQPPADRFWADPDIVSRDGHTYVFFEDASLATGKGHISVAEFSDEGKLSSPIEVLRRPYHLSYPYVFEWADDVYLVPESAENRTVELYRFTDFPRKVEFVHYLIEDIDAYDATIFSHNGLWWLFANVRQHAAASTWDEMCIFFSDSPISRRWRAHQLNPVISDVRRARPAGHVYSHDGFLYRPSQDSSYRYGYGFHINRIVELTPDSYSEELVRTVYPQWDRRILAIHTINRCGDLVASDAIYRSRI
jgi:hypothetical protein